MSASRRKADLNLVEGTAEEEVPAQDSQVQDDRQRFFRGRSFSRSALGWAIGLLLIALAFVSFYQTQRAQGLAEKVSTLQVELEATTRQLNAYHVHLDSLRAGLTGLSGQLEKLKGLADRDPLLANPSAINGGDVVETAAPSEDSSEGIPRQ